MIMVEIHKYMKKNLTIDLFVKKHVPRNICQHKINVITNSMNTKS